MEHNSVTISVKQVICRSIKRLDRSHADTRSHRFVDWLDASYSRVRSVVRHDLSQGGSSLCDCVTLVPTDASTSYSIVSRHIDSLDGFLVRPELSKL